MGLVDKEILSLRTGPRAPVICIAVALVISVGLNVALAHRLRRKFTTRSARSAEYQLKAGELVRPIEAKRLGGQTEILSFPETTSTVLYIFTPGCQWCARNLNNFKALYEAPSTAYHFVGVSLTDQGLSEYVTKNGLTVPVYYGLSLETMRRYRLGSTPQTIVISPEGKILEDWTGAFVGEQAAQIEDFFHIKLPGLKELSQTAAQN